MYGVFDPLKFPVNVTSSTLAVSGATDFFGARLVSNGSNAAAVDLYDASSATGTPFASLDVGTSGADELRLPAGTHYPLKTGVYVNVASGTVGHVIIYCTG